MVSIACLLIAVAAFIEAIQDGWREDFQLYLEGCKDPRDFKKGDFWGYIPFNKKRIYGRDGWHLLKPVLYLLWLASGILVAQVCIWAVLLFIPIRYFVFSTILKIHRKQR